jgi:hypothetical protein
MFQNLAEKAADLTILLEVTTLQDADTPLDFCACVGPILRYASRARHCSAMSRASARTDQTAALQVVI